MPGKQWKGNYSRKPASTEPEPTYAQPFFLDIETVPQWSEWDQVPEEIKALFMARHRTELLEIKGVEAIGSTIIPVNDELIHGTWLKRAPFSAEFGKIVNISMGKVAKSEDGSLTFRVKALTGRDEKAILADFAKLVMKAKSFCAFNGKEFDYPFLFRRLIIQGLPVPHILNPIGKKPWEVLDSLEDPMMMWSGTQFNHKVSMNLLAALFGIQSSKDEMDGADVCRVFYHEEDGLEKIARYGNGDIFTLANVYNRLKGFNQLLPEQIVYA